MLGSIRESLPDPTWVPSLLCPPALDLLQSSEPPDYLAPRSSICLTGYNSSTSAGTAKSEHSCSGIGTSEILSERCNMLYVNRLGTLPWLSALQGSIETHNAGSSLVVNVTAEGNVLAARPWHG